MAITPKKTSPDKVSPSAPPSCNTGAQITAPLENQVVLDWLEFTLPCHFRWQAVFTYLGLDKHPVMRCPKGLHGYREQYICSGVRVLTAGTPEMGHHVILSGDALRSLPSGWRQIVELVNHRGKFTRIDIAMDDVSGNLDILTIRTSVKSGSCISRFKTTRTVGGTSISSGESLGETEYFGSTSSRIMVRFYDKALEQYQKTGVRPCEHWVRCEMQMRDSHACEVGRLLAHGDRVGDFAASILSNYISFRRSNSDSNKTRWPLSSWWSEFLSCLDKLSISIPKQKKTLEEKAKWFVRQVAPTFSMLLQGLGSDAMQEIYKEGVRRLTPYQKDLIVLANI